MALSGSDKERLEQERQQRAIHFWRYNLRLTGSLLLIWFLVTFVATFFARELNRLVIFGFPLGFYVAAQGALLIYLALVAWYARCMNRLESELSRHRDHSRPAPRSGA
jgi:putative solute:sodium symporter small subunit